MPSSTSSSSDDAPSPGPQHTTRSTWARIRPLGIGCLVVVTAVLVSRLAIGRLERMKPDPWGTLRVDTMVNNIPLLAKEPKDTALFLGSSRVVAAFLPDTFDKELRTQGTGLTSYNVGSGTWGFHAETQRLFVELLAEAFESKHEKLRVALVELVPFHLTRRYRAATSKAAEQLKAELATPRFLLATARKSPDLASRLFVDRYLLGAVSPEAVSSLLGETLYDEPSWWHGDSGPPPSENRVKANALLAEIGRYRPPGNPPPEWDPRLRGGRDTWEWLPDDLADKLQALKETDEFLRGDMAFRVDCCDVVDLRFDDDLVADYVAYVRRFREFSDQVFVVRLPDDNAHVQPTADGAQRLSSMIERVRRETGVPVLDFSTDAAFSAHDFRDLTHLNDRAAKKFSVDLAHTVAPLLARP